MKLPRITSLGITLLGLVAALLPTVAEASISVTSVSIQASADNKIGSPVSGVLSGINIPIVTTLDVEDRDPSSPPGLPDLVNSSNNGIEWSTSGDVTIFSFDMTNLRTGKATSISGTQLTSLVFTSDIDTSYALSGFYNVDDVASGGGRVFQNTFLRDMTTNSTLFDNVQESKATNDEQFTLGETAGDLGFNNNVSGSLTGTLLAGRSYELFFNNFIAAKSAGDSGATATGNITLAIGTPEPASFILWGGLLVGVAAMRPTQKRLR